MGKVWYLMQNSDVKNSLMNPFVHYLKYGIREGRTWREPKWCKKALNSHGWVWKNNSQVLTQIDIQVEKSKYEYRNIKILRVGKYSKEIRKLRKAYVKSRSN